MKKGGKHQNWLSLQFDFDEEKPVSKAPIKSILSTKPKKPDVPIVKKRNFNFHNLLTPKTVADLAVHSKKIAEVELWLQDNVCNNAKKSQVAKFLLITGPTGSGKTITVQVLCKNMSIDLSEWVNPVDQDYEICRGPNQVTRFIEFLTESKWNSLFSSGNKKVILVEEFPNALVRNPQDFENVLEECYYKGNYPIVFICTDSFDSKVNLPEKLFTQETRDKYKIAHISFNLCATTLMKNALRRAHNLVQDNLDVCKTPSASTVNAIISSSMGDIKCAVNQYYFASLLGTADLPTVVDKAAQKSGTKRKRLETTSSIQIMARDESLGLFHGLGRVLNPKLVQVGDSWRLNCDIEKLIDEFSTQPGIFSAFLFENYIKYFGDLHDATEAAELLSLSQTFLEKWVDRQDILTFALWISVLGLMIHNRHKVSRWNQIKGPRKIKKSVNNNFQTRNLSITDLYYYNIIKKIDNPRFSLNT